MDTVAIVPKPKPADEKTRWLGNPANKQAFPFPYTMMCYMTMNPLASKAYNKLIQCCKYFFESNPILVVEHMYDYENCGRTRIFSNKKHNYYVFNCGCCFRVDLRKLSSKIWLTNRLIISGKNLSPFSSLLCDKIYRSEITELYLWGTHIPFNDFKILAQSVEELELIWDVQMFDNNKKIVLLDEMLEICPKIQYLKYTFCLTNGSPNLAASTLKNISKLQNLSNLKVFEMYHIPEIFNIQDVSDFLTKNFMDTKVQLSFGRGISYEKKVQLDEILEKIRKEKIQNHQISYSF